MTVPYNFSWVVKRRIAGMAAPVLKKNVQYLVDVGIRHLVTLSRNVRPFNDTMDFPKLKWTVIAVKDCEPPTLKDIVKFIKICKKCDEKRMALGVHCKKGIGRTGVMLASYLIAFQGLTPKRALKTVRQMRPGSVETRPQERVLFRFYNYLQKREKTKSKKIHLYMKEF